MPEKKIKVMIADDEQTNLDVLERYIKSLRLNWEVVTHLAGSETSEDLAKLINEIKPRVLLTDVLMRRANGLNVILLLEDPLPLIVTISGTHTQHPPDVAQRVFCALKKPYAPAEIKDLLRKIEHELE